MAYSFDDRIDRRSTESVKWCYYGPDVLPMWVADMDFRSPEPVIRALMDRAAHGIYGYASEPGELGALLVDRMARLYGWSIQPEDITFLPGVVVGFNLAAHAFVGPGAGMLMQVPVYHPFFTVSKNTGSAQQVSELLRQPDGSYQVDWEGFERAITPETRMFLLCNPHNPVGKVFTRSELERMAEICLRHNLVICSDEIHADFIFDNRRHHPIASLSPELAQHTVTLMAPSKTYNIAGLDCAFAITPNPELRERLCRAQQGLVQHPNFMGTIAASAAYRDGQPWLDELLAYLDGNRNTLAEFVECELPGISMGHPEGTYLGWLDCRQAGIEGSPGKFFLKKARVGMNDGAVFGQGGQGFVRLNFGCPRSMLMEALERMKTALLRR